MAWYRQTDPDTNASGVPRDACALSNAFVFVCQREGALGDEDSADMEAENGRGFEEYEWAGQKRIRATALLEGGFRGKHTHTHTQ